MTEAQGLNVLYEYLEQMMNDAKKTDASKTLKNLASDHEKNVEEVRILGILGIVDRLFYSFSIPMDTL
ncbi:MAG: hypothetical protein JW776_04340 [Candidatus Lokiarchaeota archaeon]|nr:hypothetical protein [Candidatus Lokiarchaeota archaeon]